MIVRGRGLEQGPFVSEQEFLGIVEAAAEGDVIEHEERELIESIIEFGDTVVRELVNCQISAHRPYKKDRVGTWALLRSMLQAAAWPRTNHAFDFS